MIFIPAIDLLNNQAVRLEKEIYAECLITVNRWRLLQNSQKFKLLHIIDLNGSFEGGSKNMKIVEKLYIRPAFRYSWEKAAQPQTY